jgi:hypothetical protein
MLQKGIALCCTKSLCPNTAGLLRFHNDYHELSGSETQNLKTTSHEKSGRQKAKYEDSRWMRFLGMRVEGTGVKNSTWKTRWGSLGCGGKEDWSEKSEAPRESVWVRHERTSSGV